MNQRAELFSAAARLRSAALALEGAAVDSAAAASALVQAEHAELDLKLKDLVTKLDLEAELEGLVGDDREEDQHAAE